MMVASGMVHNMSTLECKVLVGIFHGLVERYRNKENELTELRRQLMAEDEDKTYRKRKMDSPNFGGSSDVRFPTSPQELRGFLEGKEAICKILPMVRVELVKKDAFVSVKHILALHFALGLSAYYIDCADGPSDDNDSPWKTVGGRERVSHFQSWIQENTNERDFRRIMVSEWSDGCDRRRL